jgi:putative ABC transport system permease protein
VIALASAGIGPIGSLGRREPHPGWHPNIALVVIGVAFVAIAFAVIAALAAARLSTRRGQWSPSATRVVNRIAAAGAPPPVVIGAGLAVEPGRGRGALPVRSALIATAVGIAGIVAVLVFASSLQRLIHTPARWGWTADAEVVDVNDEIEAELRADARVDGYLDAQDFQVRVDDHAATGRVYVGRQELGWTVLDGRRPRGSGEVLLGARLARSLGKGVGDRVVFRSPAGDPVTLAVVGVGTGPDLSDGQFGGGLVVSPGDVDRIRLTQTERNAQIGFASSVDDATALEALGRDLEVFGPERAPDVDNLAQLGRLPELLMAFLAVLSVAVLAHSIVVTARRRRRELDTLRALGFMRRQAHAVIVIAAAVSVGLGLVVGVVLGLVLGRVSWSFTAHAAYAAGDIRVPVLGLVALVAGSLLVAFLVAVGPAWRLTRVPIAVGLREE